METRDLTAGDRRELRALVKKQFAVLRNDLKRREDELEAEVEAELLRQYRAQDEAVARAREAQAQAYSEYMRALHQISRELKLERPEIETGVGNAYGRTAWVQADDPNRGQVRRAALAAIPQRIADAATALDQDELNLLRDLTVGALDSDQAQRFLAAIPTVGQLVPKSRLTEIEAGAE